MLESDEYLKNIYETDPWILQPIQILIEDKHKLNSLGQPIKLIYHDIFDNPNGKKNVLDFSFKRSEIISKLFVIFRLKFKLKAKNV